MTLNELTARAVALRQHFDAAARRGGNPPWTSDELMQGFVVDVGALMKLVMAKKGAREVRDVDAKLGHELADCLWSVLVLADAHGVDLEREFVQMTEQVAATLDARRG